MIFPDDAGRLLFLLTLTKVSTIDFASDIFVSESREKTMAVTINHISTASAISASNSSLQT